MHACVFCGDPCNCGEQSTYFCDSCSECYLKGRDSEFDDSDDDFYEGCDDGPYFDDDYYWD